MTGKGKIMDGLGIFGIIIAAVVVIVVNYFVAKEFYEIAYEKGFKDKRYFWYSFLLSAVGYAMVIALPDRSVRKEKNTKTAVPDELPEL